MTDFGVFGYAVAGVLYSALFVLLLINLRGQVVGTWITVASAISAAWGIFLAFEISNDRFDDPWIFLIEALRSSSWLIFSVVLASELNIRGFLRGCSIAVAVAVTITALGALVWREVWINVTISNLPTIGGLATAMLGLVLIEQVYRNAPAELRWGLRPLILGVGGIFAFDLFLFSQSLLLGEIEPVTWMARGAANLFFVPMLAIAAKRNPQWDLRVFVSRQVVFFTTAIAAIGVYLLLMSLGGYVLVLYGGPWGPVARIVFFVGAILVLMILVFSNTLRRQVRVFLSKHFFQNRYDYREEWLRLVSTLSDVDSQSVGDMSIRAMAQIVGSPGGVLWQRDSDGYAFTVTAIHNRSQHPIDLQADDMLIRFIDESSWLIDLEEYARVPEVYDAVDIPVWLNDDKRAWLLIPLQLGKQLVGLILLDRPRSPHRLNYEDRDLLKTAGNHIAVHLAQARADQQLAEAQQFEAYNRLTAFLMHDLNNLIAQQSLIVSNAEKHRRKPEFVDDAINTIAGSVNRMRGIMKQLRSGSQARDSESTSLKFIVSRAVDSCSGAEPCPGIELNDVEVDVCANAEEFSMILTHLIKNAQDATPNDGEVTVSLTKSNGSATVRVFDTGRGMTAEFIRERLFRPFDTTKGNKGMGIGAYQARQFARQMGGDLRVASEPGKGTTVDIEVPTV